MSYSGLNFGIGAVLASTSSLAYGHKSYLGVLREVDKSVRDSAATVLRDEEGRRMSIATDLAAPGMPESQLPM